MATLSHLYSNKKDNGTGTTTRKTFLVPLSELYIEDGYNVRGIDLEHAKSLSEAYIAGDFVPPLVVQVTDKGVKVIDGHHRYTGARMASESGCEIARLECSDFTGSEADRVALMITSSQGRPLEPLERAAAYKRLSAQGWTSQEISTKVKRSISDVELHLNLLNVDESMLDMVKAGEIAATTAVSVTREHGENAPKVAREALEKAKSEGKTKVKKSDIAPKTNGADLKEILKSFSEATAKFIDGKCIITLPSMDGAYAVGQLGIKVTE